MNDVRGVFGSTSAALTVAEARRASDRGPTDAVAGAPGVRSASGPSAGLELTTADLFRLQRRHRVPDVLIGFADALLRSRNDADVHVALRDAASAVVEAYAALVFVADDEPLSPSFRVVLSPPLEFDIPQIPARTAAWFSLPGVVTAIDTDAEAGGPLAPLRELIDRTKAAYVVCVPVAGDALLLLIERRSEATFTGEQRDLISALVRQAEGALHRLALERRLLALPLHEPGGNHDMCVADTIMDCALSVARVGPLMTLLVVRNGAVAAPALPAGLPTMPTSALALALQERTLTRPTHDGSLLALLVKCGAEETIEVLERLKHQVGGALRAEPGVIAFAPLPAAGADGSLEATP